MGWAVIAAPGTDCGPCKEPCKHTDCADTREAAAALCTICGEPIGYDVKLYGWKETARHAFCEWTKADEGVS